jgi:hypothetical protein
MTAPVKDVANAVDSDQGAADTLARVRQALRGLRFGEVRIVVHEGAVVQVERTEKLRLPLSRPPNAG